MSSKASSEDLEFGAMFELAAAECFARYWFNDRLRHDWQVFPCMEMSDLDYIAVSRACGEGEFKLRAFIEVKARRHNHDTFETTVVSLAKHKAARANERHLKLPTFCVVVWEDAAGYFLLADKPERTEFITREDRDGEGCEHGHWPVSKVVIVPGLREDIKARMEDLPF